MYLSKDSKKFLAATVSTVMVSSISVPFVSAQQINFSDVKPDDYFYEAVQSLAARNIIQGYQDGTFKPYESVTRAQAAKMLALALGLDVNNVTDPGFKDVSKTDWFYGPVAALVKEGVLKGYEDKTFKPYQKITRAQMAKIISLGFQLKENKTDKLPFVDVKTNDWFAGFVGALYENGITTGKNKNEFAPNEPVNRGQMAAFIYRSEKLKTATQTGKIENITSHSVQLNGNEYEIDDKVKNIINIANSAILKNANVVVETKGKKVANVKYLEITSSGTNENLVLDGQQGTIDGNVKISADNITLKNLTINGDLEITKELKNNFYANNLEVKGKTIISDKDDNLQSAATHLFYKSLTYKLPLAKMQAAQESKTNLVFENAALGTVELDKQDSSLEMKGTTNVKEIVVTSNVSVVASSDVQISKLVLNDGVTGIKLNADINEMAVQTTGNLSIEGNGNVKNLKVESAANMVLNTSGKIEQLEIENENSQITLKANVRVGNVLVPEGLNISSIIKNYNSVKNQIEKVNGSLINNGTTGGTTRRGSGGSNNNRSDNSNSQIPSVISQAGTYGPSSGQLTIDGDVTINSKDVTLQNVTIKGNLVLGEEIGEGDVTLKGVTVEGKTEVKGGGENSIHFIDSVLMTVIVNKNDGKVRIVAEGSTRVVDLQLESFAKVEEMNLTGDAPGFTNVTLVESIQSSNPNLTVQLVGNFETINSRAANVKIELAEETDIETLVLNAIAAVTGSGRIGTAEINAEGITLSQRPRNLVLQIPNGRVQIGDEEVTGSYSDVDKTTIKGIKATQGVIDIELGDYVADLTIDDFKVTAKMGDQDVTLENLEYDPNKKRITYDPIPLTSGNLGKEVEITVAPADGTEKLEGEPQTTKVQLNTGFEGYITDIYGVGVEGLTIKFRKGSDAREGEVVKEVTTGKYGYYSVSLEPGTYTGEISGRGFVTSYMFAVAPDDQYNVNQNETAIRAAATSEVKIMLTWNEKPYDIDSHLIGPTPDGSGRFHTWYPESEREYKYNGITYVDLDWDDTDSYGPETTTIRKLVDGTYKFIVHNFSGEHRDDIPLRQSGAKVEIFKGNSTSPDHIFEIPAGEGNELYWTVFEMVVSNNGTNIEINPINTLSIERPEELPADDNDVDPRTELEWALEDARWQLDSLSEYYSDEELQPLTAAISAAEAALEDEEASEEEIQEILAQLEEVFDRFDTKVELIMTLEYAHSQLDALSQYYTEEELQPLTAAISAAEAALEDEEASEEEIQEILAELEEVFDRFDTKVELIMTLEYAHSQLDALSQYYTDEELQPLTAAISAAEAALASEETSEETLEELLTQLEEVFDRFDTRVGLVMMLEYAHSQLDALSQYYTEEELQPLTAAISAAEAALEDEEASEEELQQILEQLEEALDQFDDQTVPAAPDVTADDENNVIVGADATMEYSTNGGQSWTAYDPTNEPTFEGDQTVLVRVAADPTAGTPAGETTELTFTANIPTQVVTEVAFTDTDTNAGEIAGNVTWTLPEDEEGITGYTVYFLDNNGTKIGTAIGEVANGVNTFTVPDNTVVPNDAVELGVFAKNSNGESAVGASALKDDTSNNTITLTSVTYSSNSTSYSSGADVLGASGVDDGAEDDFLTLTFSEDITTVGTSDNYTIVFDVDGDFSTTDDQTTLSPSVFTVADGTGNDVIISLEDVTNLAQKATEASKFRVTVKNVNNVKANTNTINPNNAAQDTLAVDFTR
ncbi:S-layer family protein [Anoxybacillus vitaminiphilus]|uniref:S-layer family protein n=1 Tax=Paranoxybacillus vitaminiphilus TaxID=581036 RepID=A0A327YH81_9BACL|nr:DUF4073 domain-containing protein [Anoxybacillus vitaminiphilus]RAK19861.1 S-layer family protein [Anoxybacillus vitaminiphilus]